MPFREFRQESSTGKTKTWAIGRVKDTVFVRHGYLGHRMTNTPGWKGEANNIGRSNEKSAEETAQDHIDRLILKKQKEGYREVGEDGEFLREEASTEIDFSRLDGIPSNARFHKPINTIDEGSHIHKLMKVKKAWFVRKMNGVLKGITVTADRRFSAFSSLISYAHKDEPDVPWMLRLQHLVPDLEKLGIPPKSILLGELVSIRNYMEFDSDRGTVVIHEEDLESIAKIVKGKLDHSLARQEKMGHPWYYIWDLAFWGGMPWCQTMSIGQRIGRIFALLQSKKLEYISHPEILRFKDGQGIMLCRDGEIEIENFDGSEESALEIAKDMGWEGFVVVDPDGVYGGKGLNFKGKAQRPKYAAKLKPEIEADFIVRFDPDNGIGSWGKGKRSGTPKSVFAYLRDPQGNVERFIAKIGGGLSDEDAHAMADPKMYPMVWEVAFSTWTDKGSLQFSKFRRRRDDKKLDECTTMQMPEHLR